MGRRASEAGPRWANIRSDRLLRRVTALPDPMDVWFTNTLEGSWGSQGGCLTRLAGQRPPSLALRAPAAASASQASKPAAPLGCPPFAPSILSNTCLEVLLLNLAPPSRESWGEVSGPVDPGPFWTQPPAGLPCQGHCQLREQTEDWLRTPAPALPSVDPAPQAWSPGKLPLPTPPWSPP